MKISEIFCSIQGEGINTGKEAIFLRLALCNLNCSWCDTKYTWDWDNYDYNNEVKELELSKIKESLLKYSAKTLVITGGEPLLQQDELVELLAKLPNEFFVEVETNCTIIPSKKTLSFVDQWNVSPKTSNSNVKRELREIKECYEFFSKLSNAYFKFVIEGDHDITEVTELIEKYKIPKKQVILMPQASDKQILFHRKNKVESLAKHHDLKFSTRLHIEKWDDERGR